MKTNLDNFKNRFGKIYITILLIIYVGRQWASVHPFCSETRHFFLLRNYLRGYGFIPISIEFFILLMQYVTLGHQWLCSFIIQLTWLFFLIFVHFSSSGGLETTLHLNLHMHAIKIM